MKDLTEEFQYTLDIYRAWLDDSLGDFVKWSHLGSFLNMTQSMTRNCYTLRYAIIRTTTSSLTIVVVVAVDILGRLLEKSSCCLRTWLELAAWLLYRRKGKQRKRERGTLARQTRFRFPCPSADRTSVGCLFAPRSVVVSFITVFPHLISLFFFICP